MFSYVRISPKLRILNTIFFLKLLLYCVRHNDVYDDGGSGGSTSSSGMRCRRIRGRRIILLSCPPTLSRHGSVDLERRHMGGTTEEKMDSTLSFGYNHIVIYIARTVVYTPVLRC